ncbi:MAG: hypothetical protein IJV62_00425, partial [Eggerthellaceae bacterium]|nr:hypothetical protein [Eggerthellaceae bacterium]
APLFNAPVVLSLVLALFSSLYFIKNKNIFLSCMALAFGMLSLGLGFFEQDNLIYGILQFLTLALVLTFLMGFIITSENAVAKDRMLLIVLTLALLTGPLIFIAPVQERSIMMLCVFEIIIALIFVDAVDGKVKGAFGIIALLAGVVLFANFVFMFSRVHSIDELRRAHIASQLASGNESIIVEKLPFQNYIHRPEPIPPYGDWGFRLHYGIPEDVEIQYEDVPLNAHCDAVCGYATPG